MKRSFISQLNFVPGNRVSVLLNGDNKYARIIEHLKTAEKRILIANFCVVHGEAYDLFHPVLIEKARQGLEVKLLLDAYGSNYAPKEQMDELRQAGAKVEWFNPFKWDRFWQFNNRNHKKLIIADDIGYTGGIGIADFWTKPYLHYPKAWRDTHFEIEGPVVAEMVKAFAQSWNLYAPVKIGELSEASAAAENGVPIAATNSLPSRNPVPNEVSPAGDVLKRLIDGSEREINITTAYFGPNRGLRQSLKAAAKRGVSVRVLINGPYTSHRTAQEAGRYFYDEMLNAGVHIYEYLPTKIHSKLMTVDGEVACIGSANLNFRSLYHDEEFNLTVDDKVLAKELDKQFAKDLKQAMEITRWNWDHRSSESKIFQSLSSLGRYFF